MTNKCTNHTDVPLFFQCQFTGSDSSHTCSVCPIKVQTWYDFRRCSNNLEYLHVVQDVSFFMWELLDRINVCIILSSLLDLFFAGFQVVESDHVTVRNITLNAQYCLGFCKIKCFTKRAWTSLMCLSLSFSTSIHDQMSAHTRYNHELILETATAWCFSMWFRMYLF